jgi:hypothetical protein
VVHCAFVNIYKENQTYTALFLVVDGFGGGGGGGGDDDDDDDDYHNKLVK